RSSPRCWSASACSRWSSEAYRWPTRWPPRCSSGSATSASSGRWAPPTGSSLGVALALLLGGTVDGWAARSGQQLFLFSGRLLGGTLAFSVLLGVAAAGYATLRVVRLSPAEAIRRGA